MNRWNRPALFKIAPVVVIAIVLVLGTLFLVRNWSQVTGTWPALQRADLRWIAVAVFCQVAVETLISQKFRLILKRLGYRVERIRLIRSHLYRHVLATVIPFGGLPAMFGFARDLGPARVPMQQALFSVMLSSIASEIAFVSVLIPSLIWLALQGAASSYALVGTSVIVGFTIALIVLPIWLLRSSAEGGRGQWLRRKLEPTLVQLREHQIRPRDLVMPVVIALGINLCGILMMDASLRAVGVETSAATVVAARIVAAVVILLAPVFQGAGAVEFTAAGVLVAGGVSLPEALAALVVFRFVQFWLPLAAGSLARLVRVPPCPEVVKNPIGS